MGNEKGKQLKLEKMKFFKEGCISQGKGFRILILGFTERSEVSLWMVT